MTVGGGDGAGGLGAVSLCPARQEPLRRVERDRVGISQAGGAVFGDAPEHRIDQPGKVKRLPVRASKLHRKVDGGVVGNVEPKNLRGADKQGSFNARRLRGSALFEEQAEQMTQRPEPPQHRRDEPPGQRAIALGQGRKSGVRLRAVKLLVERATAAQHVFEDVGRDLAGGQPGSLRSA